MRAPRPDENGWRASPAGRAVLDALLAVVLAPICATCDVLLERPTRGPVCEDCWDAIRTYTPPRCERCGAPLPSWRTRELHATCEALPPGVVRAAALGEYDGTLREIVHALKYGRRRSLAPRLGTLMRLGAAWVLDGADAAVPVPLHRGRRRRRGFNQAADLARALGLPVVHALRRARPTLTQTDLPAHRRRANVRGAFDLARPAVIGAIRDRTLVLVDDVWTTGATLEACAAVLAAAGAAEVRAITTARATRRPPR
jgi:ComF family protein